MREWMPEDIRELLLGRVILDLHELDEYQRGVSVTQLASEPFSPAFKAKYGEDVAKALENNTASYSDDVEDQITEDEVWQNIQSARANDRQNIGLARAQRVRRSLIAFSIAHADEESEADVEDIANSDEEPETSANSDAA